MQLPQLLPRLGWTVVVLSLSSAGPAVAVDFAREIRPLLERKCLECHGPEKSKGGLRLDSRAAALKGGSEGVVIIPGNAADSLLIHLVEEGEMPSKGEPLSKSEIALLRNWINEGARWGKAADKPAASSKPQIAPASGKPAVASKPQAVPAAQPGGPTPALASPAEHPSGTTAASLPLPAAREVEFSQDIQPILQHNCLKCHGPEKPKGGFRLDNRASALKGGNAGVDIIPGKSADSPLIQFVAHLVEDMEMPPVGKGAPLTPQEIALLRAWIDQGARWGGTADSPNFSFALTPMAGWYSVNGNEAKFREHAWRREGWSGGLGRFTLENWIDLETKLTADGALDAPGNYELNLALNRQGVGFVRGGVEQFRRYYNDYGGYYEPFEATGQPAFRSGRDLHLDVGRIWTEIGLRRPRWPEITLGYEYRFKEGTKSTLHWGQSVQGGEFRNIFPASKEIDEDVHIFRADVRYDWAGLEMENNFMAELAEFDTRRFEASPNSFGAVPDTFTTIEESQETFQLANTFSLQKQIKDWWLLSGGYYYSYLDADAGFQQNTLNGLGDLVVGQHWFSQPIALEWDTHIFNASTRLGPWEGFTLSAGLQNNWERQDAMGTSTLFFGFPNPLVPIPPLFVSTATSSKQSVSATEHAALRYDRIPHTVLFAEAELKQDRTDYVEHDPGFLRGIRRDTDSSSTDQDYRAGVTLSPWRQVSVNSHYGYRKEEDRYDHKHDEGAGGFPNPGYSAFILGRDLETHEFLTRLNVRPRPWLRTLLTYQLQSSDYRTDTDSVSFGLPTDTPGGWGLAGEYDSTIYSLDVVLTPWERFSLNSAFSFHDTRTRTANNGDPAVDDYEGDIYSFLLGGTYALDGKTRIIAQYSFSRADFAQGNASDGLPLGIEYEQHSVQAGISTQFSDVMRLGLHYLFQRYDEPSSGGLNDYTAHGVFANCTLNWK